MFEQTEDIENFKIEGPNPPRVAYVSQRNQARRSS